MPDEYSNSRLETMRHSVAHIMAEAVQSIFPDVKFGIGPATEEGFYYDFDLPRSLTPDDLGIIEAKMKESVKAKASFTREEISKEEALNKGMEIAGRMVATLRNESICDGVHIMAIGREEVAPDILSKAGI